MAEKVTTMVLKVDLQCSCCYKKIKKILRKFPEIQDQIYDEKQNTVTIVVVCCSPEKVYDKLCCKGGKTIKCIEIKEPPKPNPPGKSQEPEHPRDPDRPIDNNGPPSSEHPRDPERPNVIIAPPPPPPAPKPAPEPKKPAPAPPPPPPPFFVPVFVPVCYPPMYPVGICCGQCYEGRTDGPCYHGHRRPMPSYDNYGYGPSGYGGNKGCYTSQCDYFSEINPSGCTIM
ncbi:Heavy metal-associated isoprenylated plant protein 6 [Camellia lanceoleosa]|uniref:Heavy metal-associated isoprenylated plant protein 6 n=1 Tax=Camellia lanceoleosa TaxID=1840588 RepID=A0ACC0GGZ9_9ERIC|nr:Heavy metal-associated isoprenylated plant protein 6 [Camellia lanceoleosa]